MTLSTAALALTAAAGLWLVVSGLRHHPPTAARPARRWWDDPRTRMRIAAAVAAGLGAAALTRWPVGALLAAAGGFALPGLVGAGRAYRAALARVDAVATWTEMLRDTLSAAAGLEQAIIATAPAAPKAIRAEVAGLAAAVGDGVRLPHALRAFADDLADPTADLVVAALLLASGRQAGGLGDRLGALAATAREQAAARGRIARGRAATRTATRIITVATAASIAGLVVVNRGFLAPYDSATGQFVLLIVGALFAAGFAWLGRIAELEARPRTLARAAAPDGSPAGRTR